MAEFGGGVIVDWWKGKVSEYPPALFYNIHKMLLLVLAGVGLSFILGDAVRDTSSI